MSTPDIATAVRLVADDTRESYPDMTDAQAIAHVRNTVDPAEITEDDQLAQAYRVVLSNPTPAEITRSQPRYASGSPDPAVMRAAGFRSVMVDATDVRVDDVRVSGGIVTEVRPAASGKSVWIGTDGIGSERIRSTSRITLWR